MRKLLVLGLAALLVVAFTLPASALESKFGGYWRTRMYGNANFAGDSNTALGLDSEDSDLWRVDTRTRLYYTAILNENLSLVNKFEMDAVWGGGGGRFGDYGDFGADAVAIEVKESFADANLGPLRAKIGIHDALIARGFIFADEFAGLTLSYAGEGFNLIGNWIKSFEGGSGKDANDFDVDTYGLNPVFTFGEGISINPFFYYMFSDDSSLGTAAGQTSTAGQNLANIADLGFIPEEWGIYWLGANADFNLGPASIWLTGIYQGGTIDNNGTLNPGGQDVDVSAYLFAVGANVPVGPLGVHGQFFWASGDEKADDDAEAFFGMGGGGVGWAYYWSEIMGLGIFDSQFSAGSPNADVSNIWAVNLGASIKPMEKLTLTGDIWYAQLVEEAPTITSVFDASGGFTNGEDDLGIEVDLVATYQLIEGLNLDLVGAYLFAGDATSRTGNNDDDPYEVGARLSLSF